MSQGAPYQRILLKLSGESLVSKDKREGVDFLACQSIAKSIKKAHELNTKIGIVIGGGNFIRGKIFCKELNMPEAKADQVGMLATIMNGLILQRALINEGCDAKLMSSFQCGSITEFFCLDTALSYLKQDKIVIFAGGTGNPFFTTDTAASLRALEMDAQVLLKATKVDGIYDKDPNAPGAQKYETIKYNEILEKNLQVMDATAISLCREHDLPIVVFNMYDPDNISRVILKKKCGTQVRG